MTGSWGLKMALISSFSKKIWINIFNQITATNQSVASQKFNEIVENWWKLLKAIFWFSKTKVELLPGEAENLEPLAPGHFDC